MTLIELVVALAITGMAVTIGAATFGTLADRQAISSRRADDVVLSAGARSTLDGWLSNSRLMIDESAIVFRGLHGIKRGLDAADLADDELTFFTSARTPLGNHGTIVRLHVERADSVGPHGLIADLVEWQGGGTQRIVLDTAVRALTLTYLASTMPEPQWTSSWISSTILPAAVRVSMGAASGDSLSPLMRVPMTISLENGR
jgi:hypothetical protein